MSNPVGRPVTEPCGTEAAYKRAMRHKRQGKTNCGPCDDCTDAYNEAQRGYYAKRKGISKQ